ncbi:MAG TPA: hypothetical protein VEI02_07340, partial [Planctomycetota bacterium]|nr:hypothetical protein [Planctomycetota bacterium]
KLRPGAWDVEILPSGRAGRARPPVFMVRGVQVPPGATAGDERLAAVDLRTADAPFAATLVVNDAQGGEAPQPWAVAAEDGVVVRCTPVRGGVRVVASRRPVDLIVGSLTGEFRPTRLAAAATDATVVLNRGPRVAATLAVAGAPADLVFEARWSAAPGYAFAGRGGDSGAPERPADGAAYFTCGPGPHVWRATVRRRGDPPSAASPLGHVGVFDAPEADRAEPIVLRAPDELLAEALRALNAR